MNAKEILYQRRQEAFRKRDALLENLRENVEGWKELEKAIRDLGFKQVQASIQGESVKPYEDERQKLLAKRKALLETNNLTEEDLNPPFTCSYCEDTGVLPQGGICRCMRQLLLDDAYEMSNLKMVLERENFDHFDLNRFRQERLPGESISPRENMEQLLRQAKQFIANYSETKGSNFLYYGPVGTGKTFLCNCIAKELLDRGHPLIYLTAYELAETLQHYKFSDSQTKNHLKQDYDKLFDTEVLILDDLGTEIISSVSTAQIFELLNYRIRFNKTTIISTNLEPVELSQKYSPRIFSRIYGEFDIYYVGGDDLRLS